MKALGFALVYLAGVIFAASVLSWTVVDALDYPYTRILSRSILLIMALSLIPIWRLAGLKVEDAGFRKVRLAKALGWFVIAVVMTVPLIGVFVLTGFRVHDTSVIFMSIDFAGTVVTVAVAAFLVALFEETLFRGLLQNIVGRYTSFSTTVVCVSGLYALVHFLEPAAADPPTVGPFTGFTQVAHAFGGIGQFTDDVTSFLSLFLIGVLLSLARERHGLWICIALHAGWVFVIRTFKEATVRDIVNPYADWVGTYDNFIGPLSLAWLIFTIVAIRLFHQHQLNRQALEAGSR